MVEGIMIEVYKEFYIKMVRVLPKMVLDTIDNYVVATNQEELETLMHGHINRISLQKGVILPDEIFSAVDDRSMEATISIGLVYKYRQHEWFVISINTEVNKYDKLIMSNALLEYRVRTGTHEFEPVCDNYWTLNMTFDQVRDVRKGLLL